MASAASIRKYNTWHFLTTCREWRCKHCRRSGLTCKVCPCTCKAVWQPHRVQPDIIEIDVSVMMRSCMFQVEFTNFSHKVQILSRTDVFCQTHARLVGIKVGLFWEVLIISVHACVLFVSSCCLDGWAGSAVTAASCYNFQNSRFVVTCVYVCVNACQSTKGWWISPCVSCYNQVCMHVRARFLAALQVQPIFW